MELLIHPHVGIGPIQFGMTRDEVRRTLGTRPTPFRKLSQSPLETDAFDDFALHVCYRPPAFCEAVECFGSANVIYNGFRILNRPCSEVRDWIVQLDRGVEIDHAGMKSFSLGIALYAPGVIESPEEEVQAVLVFEPGYYERERPELKNL